MRLLSKAMRRLGDGVAADFSANQADGSNLGFARGSLERVCVPFSGGGPQADRKCLLITVPTDRAQFGDDTVTYSTGYVRRGASRGTNRTNTADVEAYSNRKQFLRGQYFLLVTAPSVDFCCWINAAVEDVFSLELA